MKLKEIFNKYYERSHNPSDWHAAVDVMTEVLHFLYNNPERISESKNSSYFDDDALHNYNTNYIKIKENRREYFMYFNYFTNRHDLRLGINWDDCTGYHAMNIHITETTAKYVRKKLSNEEKAYFVLTYDQLLETLCRE